MPCGATLTLLAAVVLPTVVSACQMCDAGFPQSSCQANQQTAEQKAQEAKDKKTMGMMLMAMGMQMAGKGWGESPTTNCRGFADVVFALDSSGSIGTDNWAKQLDFVSKVAGNFALNTPSRRGYQVSVVTFSQSAKEEFPLNNFTNSLELQQAIKKIPFMGANTDTHKALSYVKDESFDSSKGGRRDAVKIVVVVTDGRSTQPAETARVAPLLKNTGALVVAIGVGDGVDKAELRMIASSSTEVFTVDNYDVLDSISDAVESRTCTITIEEGGALSEDESFDQAAYQRWSEEQKRMKKDLEMQKQILESFNSIQTEASREKNQRDLFSEVREKNDFMTKSIEGGLQQMEDYDRMTYRKQEMQHDYTYLVTSRMIQFCPLGEYKADVELFFGHGDESWTSLAEDKCNIEDMSKMNKAEDPMVLAQMLADMSPREQIEMFFSGMKDSVCTGLIQYLNQVKAWTRRYPDFGMLMMRM